MLSVSAFTCCGMSDAKALIRKGTLRNRRMLDAQVHADRSRQVVHRTLQLLEEFNIRCLHCFLAIERNREVDTWPIIRQMTDQQKSVVVSATDFDRHTMTHFFYSQSLVFQNDAFGIPSPVNGLPAALSQIDAVLIPMLAGDKLGNRIGYGKGYYDQLLAEMPRQVLKVGVNLAPLFDRFSFAEAHDIALDYIITPFERVKCHD